MNHLVYLLLVIGASTTFGIWYTKARGTVKPIHKTALKESELGSTLGKRLTLVQFSTDFCSFCGPTKKLLKEVSQGLTDVKFIEINADANLALIKKLGILSTPTTLILDAGGVVIGRVIGVPKREQIVDAISPIDI